ncbi:MAG: hypothetical protein GKS06_14175 [Acidobacteria bacterium]|nr:hypothetical protein [Acidobacteriota bacterium]
MSDESTTKNIEVEIEIDATPEAAWRAISQGEEVARWFPLNAEIEPGEGGKYYIDWGPGVAGQGTITVWEEGRRLTYKEEYPGTEVEIPVLVEWTVEVREGRTVVRMVNSGFSADDDWADYVDTLDSGWRYFMWNLKVYLERHDGTPRRMIWDRRKIAVPKAEAWTRLFGPGGLVASESGPGEGVAVNLWSGDAAETTILSEPIHVAARVPDLNDAVLFIELEPGGDEYSMGVWLSLYGVDAERGDAIGAQLGETLDALFGEVVA